MDCPKCSRELFIDRVDEGGTYWYVCMNPRCTEYRRAFNPGSGVVSSGTIKPKEFDTTTDTTPEEVLDIAD